MKHYLSYSFCFLAIVVFSSCNNKSSSVDSSTVIKDYRDTSRSELITEISIPNSTYDFGTMLDGDSISYSYKVINSGSHPLIIKSVKASCGCTVPIWPKYPINPGDTTAIKVTFKPTSAGLQDKSIVIRSNTSEQFYVLRLSGTVKESHGKE